jgi:hypothetical protein
MKFYIIAGIVFALCISCKESAPDGSYRNLSKSDRELTGVPPVKESRNSESEHDRNVPRNHTLSGSDRDSMRRESRGGETVDVDKSSMPGGFIEKPRLDVPEVK